MTNPAPGWYPENPGSPMLRYWDGAQWTQHTQHAQQAAPRGDANPFEFEVGRAPEPHKIKEQQRKAGVTQTAQGGGTLFTEPVLVVNQKVKLIEMSNEYLVFDQHGQQLGSVAQVGQTALKKAARFLTSLDQFMTHQLEVRDVHHQPVLVLTRPAKVLKSRIIVQRPGGYPVGEIVQENMIGKIRFGFVVNGQRIGGIYGENWVSWNFAIKDHTDTEIGRITKTWEGLAKTMFTTADNYVLQIHRPLPEPLASLVVASALTVDTALKQDNRGFG